MSNSGVVFSDPHGCAASESVRSALLDGKVTTWLPLSASRRGVGGGGVDARCSVGSKRVIESILGRDRALVAMIHVQALPGTPRGRLSVDHIVKLAVAEAKLLAGCGFDAVMIENMHDAPYVHAGAGGLHLPEVVAVLTRVAVEVRHAVPELPMGVQVLSGGNREAIAIAHTASDGHPAFIRCENFVFSHVADEGLLERAEAGGLLRYRKSIGAERVRVFCDIKKKHASHALTADVSLAEAAEAAEFFGADGVIVTGAATGKPTSPADVAEVAGATGLPVLVGSGVTPESAGELFEAGAGALIVGSSIKREGAWHNPPDPKRCKALVKAADKHR